MSPFGLDMGFLIEEYAAGKGAFPIKKRRNKNSIFICTIEKALGVVNYLIEENRLDEVSEHPLYYSRMLIFSERKFSYINVNFPRPEKFFSFPDFSTIYFSIFISQ